MKKYLGIAILLMLGFLLFAADTDDEIMSYGGRYLSENGKHYITTDEAKIHLLLAPSAALDSLGILLVSGDSLYVEARKAKSSLYVTNLVYKDKLYTLRGNDMVNNYQQVSTYNVVTKSCISCRLCVMNCPIGAINMVKAKAVIDPSKCVECGICVDGNDKNYKGCPTRAINKE